MRDQPATEQTTAKSRDAERWLVRTFWSLVWAPWIGALTFWSFVVRARLQLGRWPLPYDPDPKELGSMLHYVLAVAAPMYALMLTPFAVLALWAAPHVFPGRRLRVGWAAVVTAVSYSGLIAWIVMDPGWFLEWIAD